MKLKSLLLALVAGLSVSALADGKSFFKPGDTWVLSGDSITFIDLYRQTVEDALDHFHPGHGIRIVNTGVWGQLTSEAKGKGIELKPTVVSIMLGMNNVIHGDYVASTDFTAAAKRYAENLRKQVRQYKAQGAVVVLMSPTLSDERENSFFGPSLHTERGLRAYGEELRRMSDEEQCYFVPMADEFEAAKAKLTPMQNFITDGVHPYGWGQYELARSLIHHLNVAEPFPKADEARGFNAQPLKENDFKFAVDARFAAAKDLAPALQIVAPKPGKAKLTWSVEKTQLRGEMDLTFAAEPLTVKLPIPAEGLPQQPGCISRLIVSVTPEKSYPRLAVVDLARTRVLKMQDGKCGDEVRTTESRPEGPLVGTWQVREDGPDLWIEGRTYASSFPERPKPPSETWMNSSGQNGIMMMLDLRPADRFADNNFDRDMHMICFSVLNNPWAVLPLVWEGRRLANCFFGHAAPTDDGFTWRMGVHGYILDYKKFDVRKLDHFGINVIFVDANAKGQMDYFPAMTYPDLGIMTPERRLNQTIIIDRKGDVPQVDGETTNVGVYPL